jgi:hypothetical protein
MDVCCTITLPIHSAVRFLGRKDEISQFNGAGRLKTVGIGSEAVGCILM